MRIAVTSQNFRTVTGHAGRARRFIVYEVQAGEPPVEVERIDLPKDLAMHEFRGDGPHPIDGVNAILTEGFGEGFGRRMAKRGIIAATTDKTDPLEAVTDFAARWQSGGQPSLAPSCGCGHGHGHLHGHHTHGDPDVGNG